MMQQSLRDNLAVFPIPGREHGAEEEARAAEEAIRTEAYEAGRAAGMQEAEQDFAVKDNNIEQACRQMVEQLGKVEADIEKSHRHAVTEIFSKLLPALARTQAADEIISIVTQGAKGRLNGTTNIRCGSDFAEVLLPKLKNLDIAQTLKLIPDKDSEGFAVDLVWENGRAEIDIQSAVDECLAILQRTDEA